MTARLPGNDLIAVAARGAAALRVPDPVRRFAGWWLTELAGLLPHRIKALLGIESSLLVIDVTAPQLEICLWQGRRCEPLGTLKIVKAAGEASNSDPLVERASRADEVVLRLPDDQVLQRDVVLPVAAHDNLREVLGFEMDRLTPFESDVVAYDYREEGRDDAEGTLRVRLYVIPRNKLELHVSRLEALGIRATAVTVRSSVQSASMPIVPNLLPPVPESRYRSPLRRLMHSSAVLVLLLAVAAILLPLWNQYRQIDALEEAISSLQGDVQASRTLSRHLQQVADDAAFIVARKNEEPLAITYLDELTRALPDGTWLHRLELSGDHLRLQGESENASTVITLMESTNSFVETQFAAPLIRNANTGTERFSIRSRVVDGSRP